MANNGVGEHAVHYNRGVKCDSTIFSQLLHTLHGMKLISLTHFYFSEGFLLTIFLYLRSQRSAAHVFSPAFLLYHAQLSLLVTQARDDGALSLVNHQSPK